MLCPLPPCVGLPASVDAANSPALSVTDEQAWKHYVVGPPYILHRRDAFKIAMQWSEFVPK